MSTFCLVVEENKLTTLKSKKQQTAKEPQHSIIFLLKLLYSIGYNLSQISPPLFHCSCWNVNIMDSYRKKRLRCLQCKKQKTASRATQFRNVCWINYFIQIEKITMFNILNSYRENNFEPRKTEKQLQEERHWKKFEGSPHLLHSMQLDLLEVHRKSSLVFY